MKTGENTPVGNWDEEDGVHSLFHSAQNSGLNFRNLPVTNGMHFPKFRISAKEDNLVKFSQIFRNYHTKNSVPFDFPS